MKRFWIITPLFLVSLPMIAQIQYPYIVVAGSDPTGTSCAGPQVQTLANGNFYTCANGVFAQLTGGGGSPAFSAITSGTNTTAAMVVGTGGSLATSGTGSITATGVAAASDITIAANGAASTSPLLMSGSWFTGGSVTTNYPPLYIRASGASDGNLFATGNALVLNGPSGYAGHYYVAQSNGGSPVFFVDRFGGVTSSGTVSAAQWATSTNCSSSASPAVCGSSVAGSVVVAAAATTVVVDTTLVTANSQVFVQEDSSLGTKLSVTCNTTPATAPPTISARTGGTSFTITTTAPTTNPRCFSYWIIN